jgi:hypothetical protein
MPHPRIKQIEKTENSNEIPFLAILALNISKLALSLMFIFSQPSNNLFAILKLAFETLMQTLFFNMTFIMHINPLPITALSIIEANNIQLI